MTGTLIGKYDKLAILKYDNRIDGINLTTGKIWWVKLNSKSRVATNKKYTVLIERGTCIVVDNNSGKRIKVGKVEHSVLKDSIIIKDELIVAHDTNITCYSLPALERKWSTSVCKGFRDLVSIKKSGKHIAVCVNVSDKQGGFKYTVILKDASSGQTVKTLKSEGCAFPAEVDIIQGRLLIKANDKIEIYQ